MPSIYKNGALYAQTQWTNHNFADQAPQATAIIEMNGSGDYAEAFIYSTGTVIGGTSDRTYFSGTQVDGAGSGGSSGSNSILSGFPDALYCTGASGSSAWDLYARYSSLVFYALRGTSGGSPYLSFSATTGAYNSFTDSGGWSGYQTDCIGQSIAQLYAAGKAFNFVGGTTASAAGTAGQVQFNEGGNLQADPGLRWDNANKRLGIGTTAPEALLHVTGNIRASGAMWSNGFSSAATGASGAWRFSSCNDTGDVRCPPNGVVIHQDGVNTRFAIAQDGNVGIGTVSPTTKLHVSSGTSGKAFSNNFGLVVETNGVTNNAFVFQASTGAVSDAFSITNAGRVGIGTVEPSHILHIAGQGRATNSAWATSSDARVKEDIHTINGGLQAIEKLRPVTFRYTDEYQNGNAALGGMRRGFIAQEVEAALPDVVTRSVEKVGTREISDFRVLGNSDFVPLLVSAVKELKAANDNLRAANDDLRAELHDTINSQDAQIDRLSRELEAL